MLKISIFIMWAFDSEEDKRINRIVSTVVKFAVNNFENKGLISLYVAGTILTKDRTPKSDIDIFGIVESNFDFNEENRINEIFDAKKQELCGGIEARFRGIPICSLEGGEQKGVIKFFKPERFIKKLPFFKHVWGKEFNFYKDFPIKPMTLKEEALLLIEQIESSIKALRANTEKFPFQDFPKHVIELIRVEAQKEYGFKFDPSYIALSRHLINEEDHIIHKAMELRNKICARSEIIEFCNDVERYIHDLKKRVKEWT